MSTATFSSNVSVSGILNVSSFVASGSITADSYENFQLPDLPVGTNQEPTFAPNRVIRVNEEGTGYELIDVAEIVQTPARSLGISNDDTIYEGTASIVDSKLQISENLASLLQVNTRIYIEYLKDESLRLRKVEDSKEQSKVKMDDTEISFENLEDEQTELSSSLDMEKIKEIETLSKNYEGLVLIDSYNDIGSAKLITNKIRNLGLIFEENEDKINVFAGPFEKNDINLKIDFLIRNGYTNAQLYP